MIRMYSLAQIGQHPITVMSVVVLIVKPYFHDDAVTIYCGDCREIVPTLGRFDLLLTDPPYGIDAAANKRGGKQGGKAAVPSRDYGASDWDKAAPAAWVLEMCREHAQWSVLWGGNYFDRLPPARGWLVWDKDNGDNSYADCELAWNEPRPGRAQVPVPVDGNVAGEHGREGTTLASDPETHAVADVVHRPCR